MKRLSPKAARTDLTDRECTKFLAGCIGPLLQMSSLEDVRNAVRWLAENEEFWTVMKDQIKVQKAAMDHFRGQT